MILALGGEKGGSGKTTVATNLAIMRALAGRDVLVIDADPQETATDFTALRTSRRSEAGYTSIQLGGQAVKTQTTRLRNKYDDVIIDTGGRDTTSQRAALAVADRLLVPFVPRSFDVWTIDHVIEMVNEMRPVNEHLEVLLFLNKADARGTNNEESIELLAEKGMSGMKLLNEYLGNRIAFANAAAEGLSVTEWKPGDAKAAEEMNALYAAVFAAKGKKAARA